TPAAAHGGAGAASVPASLPVIVRFRGSAPPPARFHGLSLAHGAVFRALQSTGAAGLTPLPLINAVAAQVPAAGLQALLANPDVAEILPDGQQHLPPLPDLPEIRDQVAAAQTALGAGAL